MSDPLFELLNAPPLPELREQRLGALDTKWTTYRGARRPCDHCVQLIHERGVVSAPPPATATHKRVGPNDTLVLCSQHAQDMREKDARVKRERDAKVALTEHGKKAARSRAK